MSASVLAFRDDRVLRTPHSTREGFLVPRIMCSLQRAPTLTRERRSMMESRINSISPAYHIESVEVRLARGGPAVPPRKQRPNERPHKIQDLPVGIRLATAAPGNMGGLCCGLFPRR